MDKETAQLALQFVNRTSLEGYTGADIEALTQIKRGVVKDVNVDGDTEHDQRSTEDQA